MTMPTARPRPWNRCASSVESDEVLLTFQVLGTPSNAAVQKYLNAKKVPQLFAATGASKFTDPKNFPWTMGFNPNYFVEGRIYGQYIIKNHPNAKIGILYQNDDLGKDYLNGIKAGLGDKAASMIVAEASYEVYRSDHQFADPQDQGQPARTCSSAPRRRSRRHRRSRRSPSSAGIRCTSSTSTPPRSARCMKPAGLEASKGVISVNYGKDPLDPTWKDDAGMKKYFDFMAKYYPEGDKDSSFNSYGYFDRAADGPRAQAVRRRSDARERHEAGDQPEERHGSISRCRASATTPRRPTIASTSSCR